MPSAKIKAENEFVVVAFSSVDHEAINSAERFLLTTVSHVDNNGSIYIGRKTQLLQSGGGPLLVELVVADIELALDGDSKVWALNEAGFRKSKVPIKDNRFRVDGSYKTIWYEVVKE